MIEPLSFICYYNSHCFFQSEVRTRVKSEFQMIDITHLISGWEFGHRSNLGVVGNLSTPTKCPNPLVS